MSQSMKNRHHRLVIFWLWLLIAFYSFYTFLAIQVFVRLLEWEVGTFFYLRALIPALIGVLNVACLIFILRWKAWGFWCFVGFSAIGWGLNYINYLISIFNFTIKENFAIDISPDIDSHVMILIPIILVGILLIKKDGVSCFETWKAEDKQKAQQRKKTELAQQKLKQSTEYFEKQLQDLDKQSQEIWGDRWIEKKQQLKQNQKK